MRRISASVQILLLFSILLFTVRIERVIASSTIYIRADGSIDPPTANITTIDSVTYTFNDNNYDTIVVERDNILLDGQGYLLQGAGGGYGITLSGRSNVTLRNIEINAFAFGVRLYSSSDNTVSGNNITSNNDNGVYLSYFSNYNTVSGNNITNNGDGVWLYSSSFNTVSGNNITNSNYVGISLSGSTSNIISGNNLANSDFGIGLVLDLSSSNTVSGNNITNNWYACMLTSSPSNIIYHNNFVANTALLLSIDSNDTAWDNGCEGNYWSNFAGSDSNGDGIGDTPYIIDGDNQDNYPLMNPYWNPGDIDHDLDVDIFDVVAVADAYGSTPSDPNWNCHSDIIEPYGVIDIFDIVLLAGSYGEEYNP